MIWDWLTTARYSALDFLIWLFLIYVVIPIARALWRTRNIRMDDDE